MDFTGGMSDMYQKFKDALSAAMSTGTSNPNSNQVIPQGNGDAPLNMMQLNQQNADEQLAREKAAGMNQMPGAQPAAMQGQTLPNGKPNAPIQLRPMPNFLPVDPNTSPQKKKLVVPSVSR